MAILAAIVFTGRLKISSLHHYYVRSILALCHITLLQLTLNSQSSLFMKKFYASNIRIPII